MKRKKGSKLKFVILLIVLIMIAILIYQENQKIVICIDAGHGGTDARLSIK